MASKTQKPKVRPMQSPKGMHDILPRDQGGWERLRRVVRETAEFYNYLRIDTPTVEFRELFERGVGEATDIVEKQMFKVETRGRDNLVLRPEGTVGVVRAYLEHGLSHLGQPLKLYYIGPMFRHEQPQEGRFRQFHQIGLEVLGGEDDPVYDAQVILTSYRLLEGMKLANLSIKVNSIGCKSCRPGYRNDLVAYYRTKKKDLCEDCKRRLITNPLRLLDCKEESCVVLRKDAPIFVDKLCRSCHDHFKTMLEYLEELHLPYALDHYLVRGLDYYSKTVFEIFAEGFDSALAGGGRYDYLIEMMGGKATPAVGAALGIERILKVAETRGNSLAPKSRPKIFLVYVGNLAKKKCLSLIERLREADIDIQESLGKESLKAQLRAADKLGSPFALIFGQKEAFEESVIIRDLKTGAQETIPHAKLAETLKKRLR